MQPLDFPTFARNVGVALLMGFAIGLERQFRQHPAGLRTNALVCAGAAMFVSLSLLMEEKAAPTRVASYIVSGVGFLGGGVILREGLNVKGMSTAATLWCSAAVGTLAGANFPAHALFGTVLVLAVHLSLRPLALWIDNRTKMATDVETIYHLRITCEEKQENLIRTILMRHVGSHNRIRLLGISSEENKDNPQSAIVQADILALDQQDRAIQDIMSRLNIEPSVQAVSWKKGTHHAD